jgi:hypothetical protein
MKRVVCLTYLAMLVAAMPVRAQDKPFSMVGTWIGKGEAISVGESLHPEHSNREVEPKVLPITLRLEIDKQTDTTFSGKSIRTERHIRTPRRFDHQGSQARYCGEPPGRRASVRGGRRQHRGGLLCDTP